MQSVREAFENQETNLDLSLGQGTPSQAPGLTKLMAITGQDSMQVLDDIVTVGDDIAAKWGIAASKKPFDMATFLGVVYAYGYIAGIQAEHDLLAERVNALEERMFGLSEALREAENASTA